MYGATQFITEQSGTDSETDDEQELPDQLEPAPRPCIARLVVQSATQSDELQMGQEFGLRKGTNIIGRSEEADITLVHSTVSRNHCKLCLTFEPVDGSWTRTLEDLNSSNGSFLKFGPGDKYRVSAAPNKLLDQHVVHVGDIVLRFELLAPGASGQPRSDSSENMEAESKMEKPETPEQSESENNGEDDEEAYDPGATQAFDVPSSPEVVEDEEDTDDEAMQGDIHHVAAQQDDGSTQNVAMEEAVVDGEATDNESDAGGGEATQNFFEDEDAESEDIDIGEVYDDDDSVDVVAVAGAEISDAESEDIFIGDNDDKDEDASGGAPDNVAPNVQPQEMDRQDGGGTPVQVDEEDDEDTDAEGNGDDAAEQERLENERLENKQEEERVAQEAAAQKEADELAAKQLQLKEEQEAAERQRVLDEKKAADAAAEKQRIAIEEKKIAEAAQKENAIKEKYRACILTTAVHSAHSRNQSKRASATVSLDSIRSMSLNDAVGTFLDLDKGTNSDISFTSMTVKTHDLLNQVLMGGVIQRIKAIQPAGEKSMEDIRTLMLDQLGHSSLEIPNRREMSRKHNFYLVISNNNVPMLALHSSLPFSEIKSKSKVLDAEIKRFLKLSQAQIITELEAVDEDDEKIALKVKVIKQFFQTFGTGANIFALRET